MQSRNESLNKKMKGDAGIGTASQLSFRLLLFPRDRKQEIPRIPANKFMAFFNSAVGVLQTLVIALGAGLGIWGAINLLEGYGNDNPGAKSQGMKQLMAK